MVSIMARKKKPRISRRELARRGKIRKGLRKYWRRVKKVRRKHSTTLKRARRLVKVGVGRSKKERKKAEGKKERRRRRVRDRGALWEGAEYVISFEENQRGNIDVPKRHLMYTAEVHYRDEAGEEDIDYMDEFSWDAKGEDAFWGGWWTALKDWLNTMVDFFPDSFAIDKSPQHGAVEVTKVTYGKLEA